MALITGNTYPVKEQLKRLGARWNKAAKGWSVPDHRAEEARAIVAGAGSAGEREDNRTWKQKHGRCEDAPCCGCCGPQGDGDYYGYQGEY